MGEEEEVGTIWAGGEEQKVEERLGNKRKSRIITTVSISYERWVLICTFRHSVND